MYSRYKGYSIPPKREYTDYFSSLKGEREEFQRAQQVITSISEEIKVVVVAVSSKEEIKYAFCQQRL